MMKLFLFTCGKIRFKKGIFTPGFDDDMIIESPVPFFLIKHPQGNVLFDTGVDPVIVKNPLEYWGGLAKAFWPTVLPEEEIVYQLSLAGCYTEDISHVIVSHLHMDHAGGNRFFPNAKFIVQELEMKEAAKPENEGRGYFKRDWDHLLNYQLIQGGLDLFGDGKIILDHLPGHTIGQQVAIVDLYNSGKIVLASDTVPMLENLNNGAIPKNIWNREALIQSVNRLKEMQHQGALIICGHDPRQWDDLLRTPNYYN